MERPKWGTPGEQDDLLLDGSKTKFFAKMHNTCERGASAARCERADDGGGGAEGLRQRVGLGLEKIGSCLHAFLRGVAFSLWRTLAGKGNPWWYGRGGGGI